MRNRKIHSLFICIITTMFILSFTGVSSAQTTCTTGVSGEEELFTANVSPDALILLDLSGSMFWPPPGGDLWISNSRNCGDDTAYYASYDATNHPKLCQNIDPYGGNSVPRYSNLSCSGPFYRTSSHAGFGTKCSRVEIAKRAIYGILNADSIDPINDNDYCALAVRIGFMRFKGGDDTGGNYNSGNIQLVWPISTASGSVTKYQQIYCNNTTSCASTVTSCSGSHECVVGETPDSGTPLASSLNEAKLYLDYHKGLDTYAACRNKFVILITDGEDTYACGGDGTDTQNDMYVRRRESVAKAKALADAGYKVFVIGLGSTMPHYLINTLNWMAYYGGTVNPGEAPSGSTAGYVPSGTSCNASGTVTTTCNDSDGDTQAGHCATTNDPATAKLRGYAFVAADANALNAALQQAMQIISAATYSFTQASVQSSRTQDENFMYEASFEPIEGEPFWHGHLKKFAINDNGSIGCCTSASGAHPPCTTPCDAGEVLQNTVASNRKIWTCTAGSCTFAPPNFTTAIITPAILGVADNAHRDNVVGYIRGDSAFNPDYTVGGGGTKNVFKLGDVFRAAPITVGSPNPYFDDLRDGNRAFGMFRASHCRTSAVPCLNNKRIVAVGANDGQVHAFHADGLSEAWSFIPPNLLPNLKMIAHMTNPTTETHQYFVDGSLTADNVWLGSGDGIAKNPADWHTILVFGEGRGGSSSAPTSTLWSSVSSCDSNFSPVYYNTTTGITYPYNCGYYALDITETLAPTFMWHLGGSNPINTTLDAPYLGDPWSEVMIGRVRIGGNERWVGFIGGGYNIVDCSGGGACSDTRGKGFFVFDLRDGTILWRYTNPNIKSAIPAAAAIVDLDGDGFIDTAYIGDLGGNIWRFTFCKAMDGSACGIGNWKGGRLFSGSSADPVFTVPSVTWDGAQNLWVFWGTGDKTDPRSTAKGGKLFALMDNDRTNQQPNYSIGNLTAVTQSTPCDSNCINNTNGYYISLPHAGEKVLADPAIFSGIVYFTTFVPTTATGCDQNQGGDAYLYEIKYTSGAGAFSGGTMSTKIGEGIAAAPTISLSPPQPGKTVDVDLYITVSGGVTGIGGVAGGGASGAGSNTGGGSVGGVVNPVNILFWKDRRIQ